MQLVPKKSMRDSESAVHIPHAPGPGRALLSEAPLAPLRHQDAYAAFCWMRRSGGQADGQCVSTMISGLAEGGMSATARRGFGPEALQVVRVVFDSRRLF